MKPIENEKEYGQALSHLSKLMEMDLEANAEASNEFDVLALVVEDYEKTHYPVPSPLKNI